MGSCIALAATLTLTIIFYFVDMMFRSYNKLEIGKIAVRDYCAERFAGEIDSVNAKSLETMSQKLLNVNRRTSEMKVDFIKRIAKYVDWTIPEGTDFFKDC